MIVPDKDIVDLFTVGKKKRKNSKDQVGLFFTLMDLLQVKGGFYSERADAFIISPNRRT